MSAHITLSAQSRDLTSSKPNALRRSGRVPANIYGDVKETVIISLDAAEFFKLSRTIGESSLIQLSIEGEQKPRPVLLSEMQVNPLTGKSVHVSFRQVNLKEKVNAVVPIELVGEFGVNDALVVQVVNEVEVEALPTDLPESFIIDQSKLTEIGQSVSYKDLEFDRSKVTLMVGEEQLETPVVLVQEFKEYVEPEPEAAPVEGAEGAAAPTGEAAAEGAAAPEAAEKTE
jgi:large subunit ribosomal protein L25